MADMKSKIITRRGVRAYVAKTSDAIDVIIAKFNPQPTGGAAAMSGAGEIDKSIDDVLFWLLQIESRWDNEDRLNYEIIKLINDDGLLDLELEAQEAHKDERLLIRKKVAKFVEQLKSKGSSAQSSNVSNASFIRPSRELVPVTQVTPAEGRNCEVTRDPALKPDPKSVPKNAKVPRSSAAAFIATFRTNSSRSSPLCKGTHRLTNCPFSLAQRYEVINREPRCPNCLSLGPKVAKGLLRHSNYWNRIKRHNTALYRVGIGVIDNKRSSAYNVCLSVPMPVSANYLSSCIRVDRIQRGSVGNNSWPPGCAAVAPCFPELTCDVALILLGAFCYLPCGGAFALLHSHRSHLICPVLSFVWQVVPPLSLFSHLSSLSIFFTLFLYLIDWPT